MESIKPNNNNNNARNSKTASNKSINEPIGQTKHFFVVDTSNDLTSHHDCCRLNRRLYDCFNYKNYQKHKQLLNVSIVRFTSIVSYHLFVYSFNPSGKCFGTRSICNNFKSQPPMNTKEKLKPKKC